MVEIDESRVLVGVYIRVADYIVYGIALVVVV